MVRIFAHTYSKVSEDAIDQGQRKKNGKSKFLNYCRELLGDANVSYVELKEFEENRFKAAQLKDKIANIYADISFKRLASTHMIKNLVAGDEISAEEKGERAFPLRSYAKLMFSANDLPASSDTTDGFFRRFFIVPFDKKNLPRIMKMLNLIRSWVRLPI